jgi:HlyD family secretion protein
MYFKKIGLLCVFYAALVQASDYKTLLVEPSQKTVPLYFSSKISPLRVTTITSPAEGVIVEMNFQYGQAVQKNQALLKINSAKLEADFHAALSQFLQAKDAYAISEERFKGVENLFKLGIISENDFRQGRSDKAKAYVAYLEALYRLEEATRTGQKLPEDLKALDISDYSRVGNALKINYNYLTVMADADGVLLQPPGPLSADGGPVEVGTQVKLGRVLAVIGNMSGISLDIKVSEIDVLRIAKGQRVLVTGPAFPGLRLEGQVTAVDQQAVSSEGDSAALPSFPVHIEVPTLSPEAAEKLRVGMSAKIQLNVEQTGSIYLPLTAVSQRDHTSWVQVLVDGKPVSREVIPGQTTVDAVEITQGLKAGETVILPH